MLAEQYTKGQTLSERFNDVLQDTAEKLLKQQRGILSAFYNERTGNLAAHLESKPFSVINTLGGANLVIDYMTQIRFMDLKKTALGKRKKLYEPIYNKPLYGFLFGYAYHRLRLGLLDYMRQGTVDQINTIQIKLPT